MGRVVIDGFESSVGGLITGVWTTVTGGGGVSSSAVVNSIGGIGGRYSNSFQYNGTTARFNSRTLTNSTTEIFTKIFVYVSITSNPTSLHSENFIRHINTGSTEVSKIVIKTDTSGAVTIGAVNSIGSTSSSFVALTTNAWHKIEFKTTISSTTGIVEMLVDDSTTATLSSQNTGTALISSLTLGVQNPANNAGDITYFVDDVSVDDEEYPGWSLVIARQGTSGTPEEDAFTKSSGTDAYLLLSDTPANVSTFCVSPGTGNPLIQLMYIAPFTASATAHGNATIDSGRGDVLNTTSVVGNAKRSGGSGRTHQIGLRYTGGFYWSTVTLSTSDAYYGSFTQDQLGGGGSLSQLNVGQVGAQKTGGAGGQTMTINDLWVMADYTPNVPHSVDDGIYMIIE